MTIDTNNNHLKVTPDDLKNIPFFKEAIESNYFRFNVEKYIEYLNKANPANVDSMVISLIDGFISDHASEMCPLYIDFAVALKNWYVPGLVEYDDDPGLDKLFDWAKENYPEFDRDLDLEEYEWFTVGAHLYYALEEFEGIENEDITIAFCYSLYHYILYCLESKDIDLKSEIKAFPNFLLQRSMMLAVAKIFIEDELVIKGIKNIHGKIEFYGVTDSMNAYDALERSYINRYEYDDYCLSDEDEYDLPYYLYELKIFEDEFDNFELFEDKSQEGSNEEVYLAVQKDTIWSFYRFKIIVRIENHTRYQSLNLKEFKELRGKDIQEISDAADLLIANVNSEDLD